MSFSEAHIRRMLAYFEQDYMPPDPTKSPPGDLRMINAAEYTAHHIGKISRNLDRIVALLEKKAGNQD